MKLSIIIITWNGRALLTQCLEALGALLERKDTEFIVVDNGSADGTVDFLRATYPGIRLVELPENRGVAYARNRGLEQARGRYLWMLDNDTKASVGVIDGMLEFMDTHPECGVCGSKLVDVQGTVQESSKRYPGLGVKIANLMHRGFRYSYGLERMKHPFEPTYLIGACQLVRREAFEAAGWLDEHIFYGPEDADFCIRVRRAGWHIMYLPQFTILHYCQRATRRKIFSKLAWRHIMGLFYFYRKHKRLF